MSTEPKRYEFNTQQNRVFTDLHLTMTKGGLFLIAAGGLMLLMVVVRLVEKQGFHPDFLIPGVVLILMGAFMRKASGGFKQIVDTKGNDLVHLMKALDDLWGMFKLLQGSAIAAVVLMAIWIVVSVIM